MQKESIVNKLKESGCRITKQRMLMLDIILEEDCSCCKEIYYKAAKQDDGIGLATVYRFLNTLEEIGAISRNSLYQVPCEQSCMLNNACEVVLDDNTRYELSAKEWNKIVTAGLAACGYSTDRQVVSIIADKKV